MLKRVTCLLMVLMLLFGSVGAHALTGTPVHGHAAELVDLDCQDASQASDPQPDDDAAPASDNDYHHCSIALPFPVPETARAEVPAREGYAPFLDARAASNAALPPTPPPSA